MNNLKILLDMAENPKERDSLNEMIRMALALRQQLRLRVSFESEKSRTLAKGSLE